MALNIGNTFSPTNQTTDGQGGGQRGPNNAIQDAIRILSFAVPKNVGQGAPIPQQLLGGQTPLGPQLGNALAQNWLRLLFGGQGPLSANPPAQTPNFGGPSGPPTNLQTAPPPIEPQPAPISTQPVGPKMPAPSQSPSMNITPPSGPVFSGAGPGPSAAPAPPPPTPPQTSPSALTPSFTPIRSAEAPPAPPTPSGRPNIVAQVDPGVFQDASGGYWTGTWENPQYRGTYYGGGGASGIFGTHQ